jgi:hypothetical protein
MKGNTIKFCCWAVFLIPFTLAFVLSCRKPKRGKRLEMRCVTYAEGDRLIKEGWTLSPEEDGNRAFGMVYVELLEGAKK